MKEVTLFGSLLPSHPYLLPILKSIRENYDISEIGQDDDGIKKILFFEKD
jgi:hypothetical protein